MKSGSKGLCKSERSTLWISDLIPWPQRDRELNNELKHLGFPHRAQIVRD